MTLDDLDRRLLAALRANGREPVSSLARSLGVTRATVTARVDRLIANGVIAGFSVRVREGVEGPLVRAITMLEVRGRNTDQVLRDLRGVLGIAALHTTNGKWDVVAEIRCDDLDGLDRVLNELRAIDGVVNSETSLLLSSVLPA